MACLPRPRWSGRAKAGDMTQKTAPITSESRVYSWPPARLANGRLLKKLPIPREPTSAWPSYASSLMDEAPLNEMRQEAVQGSASCLRLLALGNEALLAILTPGASYSVCRKVRHTLFHL